MMTKRDITELARKLLPPGERIVAMATAPPARLRFRLEMAPGVDPLEARPAPARAAGARHRRQRLHARAGARRRIVDEATEPSSRPDKVGVRRR